MFDQLIARWWIVALRGIVALVFGVTAFFAPQATMAFLVALFGYFALADGVFTIGAGLSVNWLSLFIEGVFGGAVGLFTLVYPAAAQMWFVYLIMVWAFVTGVLELSGAIALRKAKGPMAMGERLLAASGLLSLAFGAFIAMRPDAAPADFMWTVATYAVFSGALLLALALNIRSWPRVAFSLLLALSVFGSGTAAIGEESLGPARQQAIVNLTEPTLIGSTIVQGPVMFTHDTTKMGRGEPCSTVYLFEPGKGRGEEVWSFHCIAIARSVSRNFKITTVPNAALGYGCVLTEYQFAGDSEGHGVPSAVVLAH